ncbi:hypothetical protein RHMOL_Rhmol01G0032300 [Rhododendron molle]|uniref:Uncharacterized protein n=1 Tax=Rhododendron molle TaxID=49168 RepID=A0ACC0Q078_RHOML|nr:hypothetical protein RHMOL_Rhmol01G0032300 [Rhododendron molle]
MWWRSVFAILLLFSFSLPPHSTAKYHRRYLSPPKTLFSPPPSPPNKIHFLPPSPPNKTHSSPPKTTPQKAHGWPPSPPEKTRTHFPPPSPLKTTPENTRFSPPPPNSTSPKTHCSPPTNYTPPKAHVSPASPPQPGTTFSVHSFLVGRSGRIVLGIIAVTIVFLSFLCRKWCHPSVPPPPPPQSSDGRPPPQRPLHFSCLWGFITTSLAYES